MKIRYLGTAACEGWPAPFCECPACTRARALGKKNIRTRAQALIDGTLLMDLPPDTYLHALRDSLALSRVETLLVTHSHQDHFYPMELIMRGEPYAHAPHVPCLEIFGNDKVHRYYDISMEMYNDSPNLAQVLAFHEIAAQQTFLTAGGYEVTALAANHDKNEKCLIYLVRKAGRTIFYANDSGLYPEETWAYLRGRHIDLVSFDCTCGPAADGHYHMGLPDNRAACRRLREYGCLDDTSQVVITHFSHNGGLSQEELERETAADGFIVAYDGMELTV